MVTVNVPTVLFVSGAECVIRFRVGMMHNHNMTGESAESGLYIELEPNLTRSQLQQTFLHECLHAMGWGLGWGYGGEKAPLSHGQLHALSASLSALFRELGIELSFEGLPTKD